MHSNVLAEKQDDLTNLTLSSTQPFDSGSALSRTQSDMSCSSRKPLNVAASDASPQASSETNTLSWSITSVRTRPPHLHGKRCSARQASSASDL